MSLYVFLSLIWLALIVSLAVVVVMWPGIRCWARSTRYPLALITLLFLVLYVAPADTSFSGLEYEDAFEYVYAGQVLGHDPQTRVLDLNPLCVDGTSRECSAYATLSHPIGLSTLLSWPVRIAGSHLLYGSIVSLLFMWLASIGVFILLRGWSIGAPYAVLGAILFMCTPVCLALGSTRLAEPTTAGLVVIVLLLAEKIASRPAANIPPNRRHFLRLALITALFSALTLAVFTKRESLALLLALPLGYLLVSLVAGRGRRQRLLRSCVPVLAICAAVFGSSWLVGSSGLLDWRSIRPTSSAAFSIGNLARFGGDYVVHLFSSRFLALVPLAILGVLMLGRDRRPAVIFPIILGYVLLFTSFSQDFYAQSAGQIPYYHFERYTVEIAPLLAVLGAVAMARLGGWAAPHIGRRGLLASVCILCLLIVGVGTVIANPYRRSLSAKEADLRRDPVRTVCSRLPADGWVISAEPILIFLYCDRPVHVIATETIGLPAVTPLAGLRDTGALYLWEDVGDRQLESERYSAFGKFLRTVKPEEIFQVSTPEASFALYRLGRASG
jgi:hypothetical protein